MVDEYFYIKIKNYKKCNQDKKMRIGPFFILLFSQTEKGKLKSRLHFLNQSIRKLPEYM